MPGLFQQVHDYRSFLQCVQTFKALAGTNNSLVANAKHSSIQMTTVVASLGKQHLMHSVTKQSRAFEVE